MHACREHCSAVGQRPRVTCILPSGVATCSALSAVSANRRSCADVLTAWTEAAAAKLREKGGDRDDGDAIKPGDARVQAQLQTERDDITTEVGGLESFRAKCAAVQLPV